MLVDALIFIPTVWMPYLDTGLVEHYPTLIVCGFIALTGILFFFNGMILDSIKEKERREFEFRLNLLDVIQKGNGKDTCQK